MSTRSPGDTRALRPASRPPSAGRDTAEELAWVARGRRELLLRVHRHALRREDLEDCYSQAVLELLAQAYSGRVFASRLHIANTLEQRFVSRIRDRRRALEGRSPMQAALESALALDDRDAARPVVEVADLRAEIEELVILREELLRVVVLAAQLTEDQRLVLAGQLGQVERSDFCRYFSWSGEKYRKVAQRARARLRALMAGKETADRVPPARRLSEGTRRGNL